MIFMYLQPQLCTFRGPKILLSTFGSHVLHIAKAKRKFCFWKNAYIIINAIARLIKLHSLAFQ